MKFVPIPVMLAATVLLAGCTRMRIASETAPEYAFSRIATYQWSDAPGDILDQHNTYLSIDMQKALNTELAAKGWKQVLDSTNATVQVSYYVKLMSHEEYAGIAPDRETGKWNYEKSPPDQQAYTVEEAVLHLNLGDTASGTAVWNGTLKTEIDRTLPEDKRDELFRRIAQKLVARIP